MSGNGHRIKPGEVRNPEGRNQYTYRREFELAIDELLGGEFHFRRELIDSPEEAKGALCLLCNAHHCDLYVGHGLYAHGPCVEAIQGLNRGQVIALVTVQKAIAGDEKMLPHVLDRLWPKTQRIEHQEVDPPRSPEFRPSEDDATALEELLRGGGLVH